MTTRTLRLQASPGGILEHLVQQVSAAWEMARRQAALPALEFTITLGPDDLLPVELHYHAVLDGIRYAAKMPLDTRLISRMTDGELAQLAYKIQVDIATHIQQTWSLAPVTPSTLNLNTGLAGNASAMSAPPVTAILQTCCLCHGPATEIVTFQNGGQWFTPGRALAYCAYHYQWRDCWRVDWLMDGTPLFTQVSLPYQADLYQMGVDVSGPEW